jgi:hypothetical protein
MSDIHPTPAQADLADGREGEPASPAHPHEHTRVPLIDHPRPAPPSCCHLPLLPHCLGRYYADDATLLLPRHCHHTAMLTLPRQCYRAADTTLLPLPHCRCGHTAAVTLRLLHRMSATCSPMPHPPLSCPPPTAATTPAASTPAAATPAAFPTAPVPHHHCHRLLVTPHPPQPRPPWDPHPLIAHPSPEAAVKWPEDTSNPPVHGQHTGTRGMVHPSLCRVAQHQPN